MSIVASMQYYEKPLIRVSRLLGFSIPQIMIECQYPSVKLMRGLKQLPVNAVTILMPSRSTKHDSSFQMSFWLEQLALPSMKCVDVGDWQLEPSQIQIICDAAPNLAEMRVTVDRDSTNAAMLQVLSLKQHSLRTLGLRRQPACKHGIADFTTLDLSTFSTLHTLAIDASFLFGPVSCSIVYRTAEFNHYLPELNTRLYNRSILPPNFRTLHIYFNSPHGVFSQGTHSFHGRTAELPRGAQAMEYDWMLELSRRNPSLKHLILTEERHICEGVGYGDPATPRVDAGYVTRFVVPPMVRKAFKERGLDVDIELQLRDDAPLLEAGLRFDPYYIA
ncbi:hypothetical protein BKA66DRAFT_170141 [Pyrenochaeta sp. MPI-SDFR-AT-0127]|nr:hypothetical protein BKA66DRAFT_170141 [Pyrenochaeta sp. MPI-SDFR-AT-0127]